MVTKRRQLFLTRSLTLDKCLEDILLNRDQMKCCRYNISVIQVALGAMYCLWCSSFTYMESGLRTSPRQVTHTKMFLMVWEFGKNKLNAKWLNIRTSPPDKSPWTSTPRHVPTYQNAPYGMGVWGGIKYMQSGLRTSPPDKSPWTSPPSDKFPHTKMLLMVWGPCLPHGGKCPGGKRHRTMQSVWWLDSVHSNTNWGNMNIDTLIV